MANTLIQLKKSSTNAIPSVLSAAEPAYSYVSNTLFIGTSDGLGVLPIGGYVFVNQQGTIYDIANIAYDTANAAFVSSNAESTYAYINVATSAANSWANLVAGDAYTQANNAYNWANTINTNTSVVNDQQNTSIIGAYDRANTVAVGANAWTNTVFGYSNTYADKVSAASNGWANTITTGSYNWTNAVFGYTNISIAAANTWANTVATYANSYADTVGVASNNYANATFLKLAGGTINGSLNISGNLTITGNTTFINVSTFVVNDPLIYLAGNNYTSDIVDIGFVANYNNGACTSVHTGLFRDSGSPGKEWYLFEGYDKEPENNNIDTTGNNFTLSVLNATLRTSNVILNGANLWVWINNAYSQANAAPGISNSYAVIVGAASNGYANVVAAAANNWANTKVSSVTGTAGQIYSSGGTTPTLNLITTGVVAATYGGSTQIPVFTVDSLGRLTSASNVSVQGMDYAYANTVGAASNGWANSIVTGAYNWTNTVFGYSNTYAQTVGNASNTYALSLATNINAANITIGVLNVSQGGTGVSTFTLNGVLYGNGTDAVQVTGAGTDGQVLVSQGGVPQFRMLDGGNF